MEKRIQALEIHNPGRWWWKAFIILSFDHNVKGKTYEEIKERFLDIGTEEGEYDERELTNIKVLGVEDFYYHEFRTSFIDPNSKTLTDSEKEFIRSMFPRFCEHFGIYKTGFVVSLEIYDAPYTETIKRIKDEIIHSDPE